MGDLGRLLRSESATMPGMTGPEAEERTRHLKTVIISHAREAADEMDSRTEEDYNLEMSRLLEEQKLRIDAEFERKKKIFTSEAKIDIAKVRSKTRLQVLQTQADALAAVVASATEEIRKTSQSGGKYTKLLEGLIAQGLSKLLESDVSLQCKQDDVSAVQAAIPGAVKLFLAKHGKAGAKCNVTIQDKYLANHMDGTPMAGGIVLIGKSGKVSGDNTFDARLEIASEQLLPQLKATLFKENEVVLDMLKRKEES